MYQVYADETCQNGHSYLGLGGLIVEAAVAPSVASALNAVRARHNVHGEVKWAKVSQSKKAFYYEFVDVFFDFAERDELHFHSLVVDASTFNHAKWNNGSAEIGFNKLIFQLLLYKFGLPYGEKGKLTVFLDDRSAQDVPDLIRPMLNRWMRKNWGVCTDPFRRITFYNSKASQLLQLNDLLLGSVGYRRNGRHQDPNGSPLKRDYSEYIESRVRSIQPCRVTSKNARRYSVWEFRYWSSMAK